MLYSYHHVNYKRSSLRDNLLAIVQGTNTHPTAQELYELLRNHYPGVGLATVYRNLKILVEQGFIVKVEIKGSSERFEARLDRHYHLICESCGSISDIPLQVDQDLDSRVEEVTGCRVIKHEIQFFGLCKNCR